MPKTTDAITYRYTIDGRTVEVTRRHVGTAYARNGNVSNPTEYFVWSAHVDGVMACAGGPTRAFAYEGAHNVVTDTRGTVRSFMEVKALMAANYSGRS